MPKYSNLFSSISLSYSAVYPCLYSLSQRTLLEYIYLLSCCTFLGLLLCGTAVDYGLILDTYMCVCVCVYMYIYSVVACEELSLNMTLGAQVVGMKPLKDDIKYY